MTASSELVERLTKVEGGPFPEGSIGTCWHRNPDGPEAAARILALEADKAALVEALSNLTEWGFEADHEAARATIIKHGGKQPNPATQG